MLRFKSRLAARVSIHALSSDREWYRIPALPTRQAHPLAPGEATHALAAWVVGGEPPPRKTHQRASPRRGEAFYCSARSAISLISAGVGARLRLLDGPRLILAP